MRVHRFHSPLQHWLKGLTAEIAVLGSFVGAMYLVVLAVLWLR